MLKFFKDRYEEGRTPIDTGLIESILKESVKIVNGTEFDSEDYRKIVVLMMSGIGYYFYLHPEQYVDFGKFVAYRYSDLNNLWTIEAKDGENAETIYNYYKNGGLEVEEIKKLVKNYASGLLEESIQKAKKLSEDVQDIEKLISQDESEQIQYKENKNGI